MRILKIMFYFTLILTFFLQTHCTYTSSVQPNEAIVFETENIGVKAENLRQNKGTGFDVGFDGGNYNKESDTTHTISGHNVFPGFDSGFNGNRPGFDAVAPGAPVYRPNDQSIDPGFEAPRPGSTQTVTSNFDKGFDGRHLGLPSNGQTVGPDFDIGFDGRRLFGAQPKHDSTLIGTQGYDSGFEGHQLNFAKGSDVSRPWNYQRYPRQVGERYGYGQRVGHDFDSGFDGSRFLNQRPSHQNRPIYQQNRPSFDSGFNANRPGFQNRPKFDKGFDGTRFGFGQRFSRDTSFQNNLEDLSGNRRVRRDVDSGLVDNEDVVQNIEGQSLVPGKSENFFFLQPYNKNNLPYIPNSNYQPQWTYPNYDPYGNNYPYNPSGYPQFGNNYPYNPSGFPQNGFGGSNYGRK